MTINTESAQTATATIMMTNNSTADQSLTIFLKDSNL
jgi:hypothetical protein